MLFPYPDAKYFQNSYSYFVKNDFTIKFNDDNPVTINTTAVNLPKDTIKLTKLKDGDKEHFYSDESLFFSKDLAYSGLYVARPGMTHSGNYETQLHLTSLFSGFQCNSIYSTFLSSSEYLGIEAEAIILQSTLQKMAYYGNVKVTLYTT